MCNDQRIKQLISQFSKINSHIKYKNDLLEMVILHESESMKSPMTLETRILLKESYVMSQMTIIRDIVKSSENMKKIAYDINEIQYGFHCDPNDMNKICRG